MCSKSWTYKTKLIGPCGPVECQSTITVHNDNVSLGTLNEISGASMPLCYGDDAIVLESGGTPVDIFGRIGENPLGGDQWSAGGNTTENETLSRNSTVTSGNTDNASGVYPVGTTVINWTAVDNSGFYIELTVDGTTTPLLYQDDAAVIPPPPTPDPVDTNGPIITLNGSSSVILTLGDVYTELSANAVDAEDAATITVNQIGNVPVGLGDITTTTGTYTLIYTATDSDGNVSTVVRTVTVNP